MQEAARGALDSEAGEGAGQRQGTGASGPVCLAESASAAGSTSMADGANEGEGSLTAGSAAEGGECDDELAVDARWDRTAETDRI